MTDDADAPQPAPEPVKVRPLSMMQEAVAEAYLSLRAEFTGLHVDDEEGLQNFERHLATRIAQLDRTGVARMLLQALLVERLCGVRDDKVVIIPRRLLNRRVATR